MDQDPENVADGAADVPARRPIRRTMLAGVLAYVATVLVTLTYLWLVEDVVDDGVEWVLYIGVPAVVAFASLRGLPLLTRVVGTLGSIFIVWVLLVLTLAVVWS